MCGSQSEQSHGGLIHISVKGTFTLNLLMQMYPAFNKKGKRSLRPFSLTIHYSAAYTETCFLSLPFLSNLTIPSAVANNVSSLPIITFVPG